MTFHDYDCTVRALLDIFFVDVIVFPFVWHIEILIIILMQQNTFLVGGINFNRV